MKILLLGDNHERNKNYEEVLNNLSIDYDLSLVCDFDKYDGLIVPGGIDVDPALYNQEKDETVKMFDRHFDDVQIKAINYFVGSKKPILGICRGCQLLNVVFGGTLIQDIKTDIIHSLPEHKDAFHETNNVKGLFMHELYGERCRINSLHHQAIDILGEGIEIVSKADDGIIEACRHKTLPIIMVQFHPERLALNIGEEVTDGYKLFNYFLEM